jgi:hypothetical protein
MKKNARYLSIAFITAITLNSNISSGQVRFGPKVGLNFSELPNNTNFIIGNQHIYNGYHLGAVAELKIFDHLYLQPGVFLTNKGSKYNVANTTSGTATGYSNFQFSCFYTDLQLNFIYNFDFGSFKLFLLSGPQIGLGLNGKWTSTYKSSSKVHFGYDPQDDFKPLDYGINFGGGIEIGRIQFSSQYYVGLKSLSTTIPPLEEQKYKNLSISFSYLFGNENVYRDYKSKYLSKHKNNKKPGKKRF